MVFSTAFMGIVANIISLVYRVIEYKNMKDATWALYAIFLASVVELNIAIIVCSVPGFAKFFTTCATDWTPIQSLRSKFFSPVNSPHASGSNSRNNHGWPAAHPAGQSPSHHDVEVAAHDSTSASLHRDGVNESNEYVDPKERWQVDPYLDTRGPEYSWMYTESQDDGPPVGTSPLEDVYRS